MEQERTQNHNGKLNTAACWMEVLPIVSAYVRSMILEYHDAEDVIQNIAVVFAEKFAQVDPCREVVPWVLRIARYEIVNYFCAKGQQPELLNEGILDKIESAYQSIHSEANMVKTALHECIKKLNDRLRHILELRYLREMAIADISKRVGISSNAVYIILCRAREALAQCVQRKTQMIWITP